MILQGGAVSERPAKRVSTRPQDSKDHSCKRIGCSRMLRGGDNPTLTRSRTRLGRLHE